MANLKDMNEHTYASLRLQGAIIAGNKTDISKYSKLVSINNIVSTTPEQDVNEFFQKAEDSLHKTNID